LRKYFWNGTVPKEVKNGHKKETGKNGKESQDLPVLQKSNVQVRLQIKRA
jgi:hypothetical protein